MIARGLLAGGLLILGATCSLNAQSTLWLRAGFAHGTRSEKPGSVAVSVAVTRPMHGFQLGIEAGYAGTGSRIEAGNGPLYSGPGRQTLRSYHIGPTVVMPSGPGPLHPRLQLGLTYYRIELPFQPVDSAGRPSGAAYLYQAARRHGPGPNASLTVYPFRHSGQAAFAVTARADLPFTRPVGVSPAPNVAYQTPRGPEGWAVYPYLTISALLQWRVGRR